MLRSKTICDHIHFALCHPSGSNTVMSDLKPAKLDPVVKAAQDKWIADTLGVDIAKGARDRFYASAQKNPEFAKRAKELQTALEKDRAGRTQAEFAEDRAGEVLAGMEAAGNEYRKEVNKRDGGKAADLHLSHAVSGHGKDTDQISRLVHGRRADEIEEDRAHDAVKAATTPAKTPATTVTLTGNPAVGDATTPEYNTIGSDPSNTSGAFKTHGGMLEAVNEGFAQAGMISRQAQEARARGETATFDQTQREINVGSDQDIGYNVAMPDTAAKLKTGAPVTPAEMQTRFDDIQRTDGLTNAKIVMQASKALYTKEYMDGEKAKATAAGRPAPNFDHATGFTVQTAFAGEDAADTPYATPDDVAPQAALNDAKTKLEAAKTEEARAEKALTAAEQAIASNNGLIASVPEVAGKTQEEVKAMVDAKNQEIGKALKDQKAAIIQQKAVLTNALKAMTSVAVLETKRQDAETRKNKGIAAAGLAQTAFTQAEQAAADAAVPRADEQKLLAEQNLVRAQAKRLATELATLQKSLGANAEALTANAKDFAALQPAKEGAPVDPAALQKLEAVKKDLLAVKTELEQDVATKQKSVDAAEAMREKQAQTAKAQRAVESLKQSLGDQDEQIAVLADSLAKLDTALKAGEAKDAAALNKELKALLAKRDSSIKTISDKITTLTTEPDSPTKAAELKELNDDKAKVEASKVSAQALYANRLQEETVAGLTQTKTDLETGRAEMAKQLATAGALLVTAKSAMEQAGKDLTAAL